jgi:hypothetical protein
LSGADSNSCTSQESPCRWYTASYNKAGAASFVFINISNYFMPFSNANATFMYGAGRWDHTASMNYTNTTLTIIGSVDSSGRPSTWLFISINSWGYYTLHSASIATYITLNITYQNSVVYALHGDCSMNFTSCHICRGASGIKKFLFCF